MMDNINPNSNFHPYQPIDAVPHAEKPERGVVGLVEKAGMDPDKFRNLTERVRSMNGRDWLERVRSFTMSRLGLAFGSIAVAAIGAVLMRRRIARR
jgi:hypothetical protein